MINWRSMQARKLSKPSIAVLPFTNMSGDPEQQYFTDGITNDIITELSRFRSLFVIARNSSFQYGKDRRCAPSRLGNLVFSTLSKAACESRAIGSGSQLS